MFINDYSDCFSTEFYLKRHINISKKESPANIHVKHRILI